MPDPVAILTALAVAGGMTLLILLGCRRLGDGRAAALGRPLAVGLGFVVGAVMLGFRPRGLLATDQERLLLVVVPLAVAVESLFLVKPMSDGRRALVRGCVALASGPLLLLGSVYMTGQGGGGSPAGRVLFLAALGVMILLPWLALAALERRRSDPAIGLTLAAASLAAGLAIMLSGYASAGQFALPLAASQAVAACAALPAERQGSAGAVGVGWVCLAGLLFCGRFFGSLTTTHEVLLGVVPLVWWLAEYRPLRFRAPWLRRLVLAMLALLVLGAVVWQAQDRFRTRSGSAAPGAGPAPTMQDYLDFGR